jgi:trans-aconitate methyltransferase
VPEIPGLFEGAAGYYRCFRVPYPDALIADIVAHFGLDGTGRLLDIGCGPGTLTFPLAPYLTAVVAIDADEGMIEEAKRQTGGSNVEWRVMRGEEIGPEMGRFRLVTLGSSLHWMDRDLVLNRVREMLEPDGGVALASGIAPWWDGPEDWHKVLTQTIRDYLGDQRRAGATVFKQVNERFEQMLDRLGWRLDLSRDYLTEREWDIDSVIGCLWSTSFAARPLFGDRVDEFEADLRWRLLALRPEGRFRESAEFSLICARP